MQPIWALGCMTGTSMDGVDAALIRTDGEEVYAYGPSLFRPFSIEEREVLAAAQGLWPGQSNALRAAEEVLHQAHVEVARQLPGAEVIGFHGQTVAHDPSKARTHQLGDAERLAEATGLPVIHDFRSADMAAGGQGAPLAPIFHRAAAQSAGLSVPVVFLNIGGVGNVTWVDPTAPPEEMVAFDTGPGNALIDDFMQQRTGATKDTDGVAAAAGVAHTALIEDIGVEYVSTSPPKSLDRHDFHHALERVAELSTEDGAATLTALTIASVKAATRYFPTPPMRWLVCGGGRHNPVLMTRLRAALGALVDPVEAVGLDGDQLEAQAFGYLAVRHLRGLPNSFPKTTGCTAPVVGGRRANPQR
ncbi:MAG: anhydro-N-acetylmuramic acid kinase [Pseudomonadota bacterium]